MDEESLFAAALEKSDPAERRAFLDEACGPDAGLRRRLERLLAADEHTAGILSRGAVTLLDSSGSAPLAPLAAGEVLAGRFRLRERLGAGGMGEVWVADQLEPVQRRIALKVIRPGLDSATLIARFDQERQALARMDHPGIAKVLDAGTTEDGQPYFVMELIQGVPITEYCDAAKLSPRQRLELFVPVCQAVQHAHQKGIIHRDLKPSNVLVAVYDDKPAVKVIDFGVAKATGQPLTEETLHTGFGTVVGTVEYMSPEQASFDQLDIDTRSDVYSLGVLLYELLAGSTPLEHKRAQEAGVLEALRIVREEEPPALSSRIGTTKELPAIAANRSTDPARLTKLVRGELDWLVMKALEKDRDHRYETANGLALDIQRYLSDEPVQAGPPSVGYRLRKFVRRNKGRVAASVALALSLSAGVVGVTAVQVKANRDRAAREAWTTASITAAVRDAHERAEEAWNLSDYPDRMQLATEAAVAAVRRADDSAAGGTPAEAALAELTAARRDVDELARHTRLITAGDDNRMQLADDNSSQNAYFRNEFTYPANTAFCDRQARAFREFGLDPVTRPVDDVARTLADSQVRDSLLGMVLEWHEQALVARGAGQNTSAVRDRLGQVVRAARQLCGGAYAKWQELLDRNDVPGLVAFAASPDGLSFRSPLVGALGRDLDRARQYAACRAFLRAAVDHYPHDVWLHDDLSQICRRVQPPDYLEALRHSAAASVLRPRNARIHYDLGNVYLVLGAYDQAVAACRKSMELNAGSAYPASVVIGAALAEKKDFDGAIAAFRQAVRLNPDVQPPRALRGLVSALLATGQYAEALRELLATFDRHPAWANQTGIYFRYDAARAANNCANGNGVDPPPPAERPAYRKQALAFLAAELTAFQKLAARNRTFAHQRMQHWLGDNDLASVRDPAAVGLLPPDERDAWNKLWADVRDLRDRTAPPAGPPQPVK